MYTPQEQAASCCRVRTARHAKKSALAIALLTIVMINSAIELHALPSAPSGLKWQKVEILSDEFDGTELDSTKWDDYHPHWSGRPPSQFKQGNSYVQDGNLCLKSGVQKDPSTVNDPFDDIWVDAAACVSKGKTAQPGYYYEAYMKASNISMTSSFWFRVGDYSEIDVIEHIGNPSKDSRDDDLPYEYHANTHVYGTKSGASVGKGWDMPTRGRDEYHLYGFWWKDPNTLWFYHNGEKVMEITPSVPFEENLKMVFDTEVFPFETAGVANIGLPLVENLNDDTKNTMYVDYVRTYELVADETAAEITFSEAPAEIVSTTSLTLDVDYTATEECDLLVALYNPENDWLGASRNTVQAGSGTETMTINLGDTAPPPSAGYTLVCDLREVGGSWETQIVKQSHTIILTSTSPQQQYTFDALTDFTTIDIDGFAPAYADETNNALAINAATYKDQFAAASTTFNGESGNYDFTITTLCELDGESTYRLSINGVVMGTYQNPETEVDYATSTHTWTNIPVTTGDKIRIEFSSHTNGKIPEGSTTAYSRGRWRTLVMEISGNNSVVSGELKQWHKITVTFDGPTVSETDATNPFTDYRLDVTFTNGIDSYVIPGYFAADGDAANTSATSGDKWRVHFAPPTTGDWTYTASFRTGTDAALALESTVGSTVDSINGKTGTFTVTATDKTGRDHRGKGRLEYVGEHYLRFAGTGDYFLKAGADSPENLLAYEDFDATPNAGNYRKSWAPHQSDYVASDASSYTWQNGKGSELLGAIKYLSDKGMNAFSTLLFNIDGDDKNIYPHLQSSADATTWSNVYHERFDVSKMDQWEKIFEYGDKKGMYLHFKLTETENEMKMDDGDTDRERKVYLREMIARYGHHLALNWNLGEENGHYGSTNMNHQQRRDMAAYVKAIDPYDHHIVIHTAPDKQEEIYPYLTGSQSEITGVSLQTSKNTIHSKTLQWYNESAADGKKWVIANDEQGGADSGVACDSSWSGDTGSIDDNRKEVRDKVLWGNLMAGGGGVEYYFGYQTGSTDLTAQDWRSREIKWNDAKIALDFFNTYLPFNEMAPMDSITSVTNDYAFGNPGHIYAIYMPYGGSSNITLPEGSFVVQWYNPRTGGELTAKTAISSSISAPDSDDWVALITPEAINDGAQFEDLNGLVVIEAENVNLVTDWAVKTDFADYSDTGYLEYTGNNSMDSPNLSTRMTYKVRINNPGTYRLKWRSRNGHGAEKADEENDTWLMIDADDFYGMKNGTKIDCIDHYMKVWIQDLTAWSWNSWGEHGGENGIEVYATFNNPGVYDVNIAGRSKGHVIDRIVMYKTDASNPTSLEHAETSVTAPPIGDYTPVVTINGPVDGATLSGDLIVAATANVQDANISSIKLIVDGTEVQNIPFSPATATANVTFDAVTLAAGNHTYSVNATADNGEITQTSNRTITFEDSVVTPPTEGTVTISPVHDAYLQGTTLFNSIDLRVEANNRVSYLQFDLSSIDAAIASMKLKLPVGSDAGNGTITVSEGSHSNWTESNLSSTNKPSAGSALAQTTGALTVGQTYEYDVTNAQLENGKVSFVITMAAGGNDVSFASSENSGAKPELEVSTVADADKADFILHEGYQIVSLDFVPETTELRALFDTILGQIEFIQSRNGHKLFKNNEGTWVNNIGDWDSTQAYVIKATGTAELDVAESTTETLPDTIELEDGINLIPIYTDTDQPANVLYQSILDTNVIWIRDLKGNYLRKVNDTWIDSIKEIKAGSGLVIKVSGNTSFSY